MNQDQFSNIFLDQSKNLFWVIDLDYRLVEANKAYFNLAKINTGKEQKLNDSVLTEALSKAELKKWKTHYDRAIKGTYFEVEEHYFNSSSQQTEYIQVVFQPLKKENDEVFAVACLSKDITSLMKQRAEANQMMDASLDVFCTINKKGEFVYVSAAARSHWGYSPEELVGKPFRDLIVEEDVVKTNEITGVIHNGEEVKTFVNRYKKKNGGVAYNWWSATWDSATGLMHGVARDAKEKIKQEEKVQLSEQRLKSLVQGAFDLVGIIDSEGIYTYMGPSSLALTGIAPKDFIGKKAFDFIHPNDADRVSISLSKVKKQDRVHIEPFRAKNHKNEWRWLETMLTNMLDNPAVKGIVVNTKDITSEVEERQRQKLLESVITNANDAVLITEAEPVDQPGPKIIYVNEAFTKMTGYEAEEVIGQTPRILQGPKSNFEELEKLGKSLKKWEPYEITTINYKKNGEEFWINFTVTPVADENGWYTHWIAIERDVTEQKNQEREHELLARISLSFGAKNTLSGATEQLCKTIGDFGKFDWVEVWASNFQNSQMQLLSHFVAKPADEEFYDYAPKLDALELAHGLAGHVWNEKTQLLWDHAEINQKFLRKEAANKIGLKAMLGIPLILNDKVLGVIKVGTRQNINYLKSYALTFKKLEGFIGSELNRKSLENDMAHLIDAIPEIICVLDFTGKFLKINKAGSELLGSNFENILNHSLLDFTHPADENVFSNEIKKSKKKDTPFNFESRFFTNSGDVGWLSWYCSPVQGEGLVYATAKDITQEKSLRELNKQVGNLAKIGSWEVDLVKQSTFWSEEVHDIHQTDIKTFVPSLEGGINFYREDFREMVQSIIENTIITGESWDFEAVIVTAKKNELWVRVIGNAEFKDGKCVRIYGGFQDIDARKQSENKLISLSQNLPGIVYEYHIYPDGTDSVKNLSGKVEELWGFTAEEVMDNVGLAWKQIEAGGKMDEVQESIRHAVETKTKWQCLVKYIMPTTGKLLTHLGFGMPTFLADGTIVFNSMILDVTKESEYEDLLEQTTKIARIGSWEMGLNNQEDDSMLWSPIIRDVLELNDDTPATLEGLLDHYVLESKQRLGRAIDNLIKEGLNFDEELLLITAKGNEQWVRVIGSREVINKRPTKIYGSIQDINEKKIARLELEKSLKSLNDYKFSLDQAAIIAFTDQKGVITSVNENFCKISGYKREELIGKTHRIINSNHHPATFFKDLWKTIGSGKVFRGEIKNQAKDGSYYWVDTTIVPFLNEKDRPTQYLAIRFDITDRKEAEEKLAFAAERLRLATSSAKMGIWDWDITNDNLTWDDRMYELYGVKEGDFDGALAAWEKGLHPNDIGKARADLSDALKGERDFNSVFRVVWPDKSVHFIEGNAIVSRDKKGKALRMIGGNIDITERRKAEQDILKANERFEKVTEATNDVIWDWDIVQDKFYRSKAIKRFFGAKASRALTKLDFWKDSFHPDDIEKLKMSVEEAVANPKAFRWEAGYRVFNEIGEELYVIDQGVIIRNKKGKATRMVGAMTDVTEQRKSEKEDRFKANLLKTVEQAAIATNLEGKVNYWNKAAETIYGWTREEALGKNIELLRPRDIEEEEAKKIKEILMSGKAWSGEHTVQRKDGTKFPVRVSNAPVYDENNKIIGIIGISSDTTQEVENEKLLKQYTEDLERSNQKLRKIAWTQSHVVRAPLSRILGIINLIELQEGKMDDILTWIEQLKISTMEMDVIVKKIVDEANHLD